ncbi:MAG: YciI family protein [Pseudomonadota bacterium]
MQYMLIQYPPVSEMAGSAADGGVPDEAAWQTYTQILIDAGVLRGGNGLQPPSTATTVSQKDGKRVVQDGPFADSKAQLGGYYIIEVADLDAAIALAEQSPAVKNGSVEIRPVYAE